MNGWYPLNFFIALIPAVVLGNWIYCKNEGSIIAIIIFHFVLNIFCTFADRTVRQVYRYGSAIGFYGNCYLVG
jgi:membrane protease YdiL (CAAX protease family)